MAMDKDLFARHFTQRLLFAGLQHHYIEQIGQNQGKPVYSATAKAVAQLAADILGGFVAQADADNFRDFTPEEKRDLEYHLKNLLDALKRS